MLTRFVYRAVSVMFFVFAIVSWLAGALCFALQFSHGYSLGAAILAVWACILGFMLMQASGQAWRTGRYDPLYDGWHSPRR